MQQEQPTKRIVAVGSFGYFRVPLRSLCDRVLCGAVNSPVNVLARIDPLQSVSKLRAVSQGR